MKEKLTPPTPQPIVLLPCPFCGGKAIRSHHDYSEHGEEVVIGCEGCLVEIRVSDPFDGECEGIWNERYNSDWDEAIKECLTKLLDAHDRVDRSLLTQSLTGIRILMDQKIL